MQFSISDFDVADRKPIGPGFTRRARSSPVSRGRYSSYLKHNLRKCPTDLRVKAYHRNLNRCVCMCVLCARVKRREAKRQQKQVALIQHSQYIRQGVKHTLSSSEKTWQKPLVFVIHDVAAWSVMS